VTSVYIAAPFHRRAEMASIAAELRACGLEVVSRWHDEDTPIEAELVSERARELAERDISDINIADTFVVFTEPLASQFEHRSGHHIETGIALAWDKRVLLVGHKRNVFHDLPEVEHFTSWRAARTALGVPVAEVAGAERRRA